MASKPKLGRTLRSCAAIFCIVGVSACPGEDDDNGTVRDAGSPNGEAGNSAGRAGHAGTAAGAGRNAAGAGGRQTEAGKGGTAGTIAQAGSGGQGHAGAAGDGDADGGMSQGQLCGTRGASECKAEEFCNYEPDKDCGATDRGGSCEAKPDLCTDDFTPVCGCDDQTYSNACGAHAAGMSVKHTGACASGGATCGGIASLECGAKEFCNYEAGQGCDGSIADAAGKCEAKPMNCTKDYRPVCSCERKTEGNACSAHSAGASVLHDGACTVSDCTAIGGRAAVGIGPAPMCDSDEISHTSIINDDGSMAIEGMLCCVKK